jgi:hypothetical protein
VSDIEVERPTSGRETGKIHRKITQTGRQTRKIHRQVTGNISRQAGKYIDR